MMKKLTMTRAELFPTIPEKATYFACVKLQSARAKKWTAITNLESRWRRRCDATTVATEQRSPQSFFSTLGKSSISLRHLEEELFRGGIVERRTEQVKVREERAIRHLFLHFYPAAETVIINYGRKAKAAAIVPFFFCPLITSHGRCVMPPPQQVGLSSSLMPLVNSKKNFLATESQQNTQLTEMGIPRLEANQTTY